MVWKYCFKLALIVNHFKMYLFLRQKPDLPEKEKDMFYNLNSIEERIMKIAREKRVTAKEAERIMHEMDLTEMSSARKIIAGLLLRGWQ